VVWCGCSSDSAVVGRCMCMSIALVQSHVGAAFWNRAARVPSSATDMVTGGWRLGGVTMPRSPSVAASLRRCASRPRRSRWPGWSSDCRHCGVKDVCDPTLFFYYCRAFLWRVSYVVRVWLNGGRPAPVVCTQQAAVSSNLASGFSRQTTKQTCGNTLS
jgi:hypothetical protein